MKYFSSIGQLSVVSGDPLDGLPWPAEKISPWSCSEQILGHRARLKAQDGYKRSHGLQLSTSGLVVFFFFFFPFFMVQNIFAHVLNYSTAIAEFTIWTRLRGKEGFPGCSGVKNPPAGQETKAEASSNLGWGRSPGGGHDNPLQHSCLENPMHRGVLWATPHRTAKSWTRLKWPSTHTQW